MRRPGAIGALAFTFVLAFAFEASAQGTTAATNDGRGYGYKFDDDLLQAPGLAGHVAQIRILQKQRRDMLIRPRLHFVPEMIKSAEKL
jgi:hypothetical protein